MHQFIIVTILVLSPLLLSGQDQNLSARSAALPPNDTTLIKSYEKMYNPRKALLYAAVLPGLGQVYNKKYWKVPLVYGGIYALGRFGIRFYNDTYKKYRAHYFYNLEHNLSGENDLNPHNGLTTGQLSAIVQKAQRARDFTIVLMGGIYLLQMIDAHVDAHLKEFDLNPDLQVSIEPLVGQDIMLGRQTGVAFVFRF